MNFAILLKHKNILQFSCKTIEYTHYPGTRWPYAWVSYWHLAVCLLVYAPSGILISKVIFLVRSQAFICLSRVYCCICLRARGVHFRIFIGPDNLIWMSDFARCGVDLIIAVDDGLFATDSEADRTCC